MKGLLAPGALFLAACAPAAPPDVVLITVDTLRADHLGAYGASAPATPHIDRLAREGLLFERASAPMPLTLPAHFSIFTGRYPREHGVLNNALALPDSARTLAEILAEHGYRTGAFTAVSLLDRASGAAQGFEHFRSPEGTRQRRAEEVVPEALHWVAGLPDDAPFFLWVHLYDPHLPYDPPNGFRDGLDPELARTLPALDLRTICALAAENQGDVPAAVLAHGRALYRGEVAYADHWVGTLLTGLERPLGPLVVLTADHGESFEDGVFFEHAESLFEAATRIPLILRHPRLLPAGERRHGQASAVDIAPTILDLLGIAAPPGSGRSLLALADDAERYVLLQHPLYSSETLDNRTQIQRTVRSVGGMPTRAIPVGQDSLGLVGGGWRFLRAGEREELYPELRAAGATRELAAEQPETAARLRALLDQELALRPLTVLDASGIEAELLEELRELGYTR
jgi:arylsulfatase A-like enzyme